MKRLLLLLPLSLCLAFNAAAQDWAKARIENSPRHHEWIKVKAGEKEVNCSIAFPEVKDKATAVIVIHEIFGLTDWVRSVTDQLAEAGYIAIAPDFLSGMATNGGGSAELGNDGSRRVIGELKPEQITAYLDSVVAHAAKLPACNGKVVVSGFCWGGSQTFRYATHSKDIKAAFVFYGSGPDDEAALAKIAAPVHGFYGGNDARVNTTIPKSTELMKKTGKTFEPVIYEGAGHGFMRSGEDPAGSAENKKAREEAWTRWKELLKKI
jgi:carboxymethylenebutenolidase